MKRVKVIVKNHDNNLSMCLYEGHIEDDARTIKYLDKDGSFNEIVFQNKNILEIKRKTSGFSSTLYLSKDNAKAHVEASEGAFDIPIAVSNILFTDNLISASYDTGEKIEVMIEFKE